MVHAWCIAMVVGIIVAVVCTCHEYINGGLLGGSVVDSRVRYIKLLTFIFQSDHTTIHIAIWGLDTCGLI